MGAIQKMVLNKLPVVAPERQSRGLPVGRRPERSDEGRRPERSEGCLATLGRTKRALGTTE
jgi:hypothetical protein